MAGKLKVRDEPRFDDGCFSVTGLRHEGHFRAGDWIVLPSQAGTPGRWRIASVSIGMARDGQGMPYTPFRLKLPGVPWSEALWLVEHLEQGQVLEVNDPDPSFQEPQPPERRPWWRRWFTPDI